MPLKQYQERQLREADQYLALLAVQQQAGNKHAALDAWEQAKEALALAGHYQERKNGLGKDLPTFCIKVVSLNNTASQQAMTQLVGRVLRQPDQSRTAFDELNESYVYCLRRKAAEITREVKKALEDEGYEGEAASVVDQSGAASAPTKRATAIRREFSRHYRKPFEGKIYLPNFCVKNGANEPDKLDYFRHLLCRVDVDRFDYAAVDWDLAEALSAAKDLFYRIGLNQEHSARGGARRRQP